MSAYLGKKLELIEMRISNIENRLEIKYIENSNVSTNESDHANLAPSKEKESTSAERNPFGNAEKWLGIVAVICFVLAAGFIIKLSIDSGWITNERRIGLAVVFGISLVTCGIWFLDSNSGYSGFLAAGGIIVLYSSNFAALHYYSLISFGLAMASSVIISGLCLWVYTKTKHPIYAITASVGSYISPVLLSFDVGSDFSFYYFVMCSIIFSLISIRLKARLLAILSSYLAILMSSIIDVEINQDAAFISIILAINFVIFSLGTYLHTKYNNLPLTESEASSFIPVLLLFYAMEYYLINNTYPGLAPWVCLCFAGFLIGLYLLAQKHFLAGDGAKLVVVIFSTIILVHSFYMNLIPDNLRSWILVIFMVNIAFNPSGDLKKSDSKILQVPLIAATIILIVEYISIISDLLNPESLKSQVLVIASFASFWMVIIRAKQSSFGDAILFAAHLLAIIGLYRFAENANSFVVSSLWLFYALFVIVLGFLRQDKSMAKSALFVLAFAAGKVLLYDAAHAPTVLRISCLILTGVVFYICGILLRKISTFAVYKNNNSPS